MKLSRVLAVFGLMFAASAQVAMAQPSVVVEDAVVPAGTPTVPIDVTFTPDAGNTTAGTFEVAFNSAELSLSDISGCAPSGDWVCSNPEPGIVRWVSNPVFSGDLEGFTGSIVFDLSLAVAGVTYPLVVQNEEYLDLKGAELTPTGTMDGSIEITGPSYASNPAPGPIDLGAVTQNDTDPTANLEISNDGATGTTLNGSCSLSGPQAATFSLSPDNTFSVLQGEAADVTTITCDSAQAVMTHNATLSCTHDGDDNPASPVEYDLSCTINAEPSPEYGSTPVPGSTIEFGGPFTTADPPADQAVTIENIGNADGLNGACSITTNPNGAYSIDSVADYGPLAQGATATRTVTCNTSNVGNHDGGVLSCTHNGTAIASPATYTLNCEVTPTPEYSSTPAPGGTIDLGDYPQNNTPTDGALEITNIGEAGSTLTGTCSLTDGSVIMLTGSGEYSDEEGGGSAMVGLTCDTSQPQGDHSDTLTCTDNDPNSTSPHTYTVECGILPPDPAIYDSTPAPGATISVSPAGGAPVGADLTDAAQLAIRNAAETGDDFLQLQDCQLTGPDAQITANPSVSNAQIDPDDPDTIILFSCDTSATGSFSNTYSCPFDDNPSTPAVVEGGVVSPAEYTVTCEVREPFSEVVETPASGTPQTAEVGPGESHTFNFLFEEVLDEGLDATLDDCSLASGTDFAITSPASFPQTIPSGGSVQVDVQFTDPGTGDNFTDTLNCTYTDNQDGGEPEQTPVSWPLEVNVTGRNVTFRVTKDFSDDNPAGVEVMLECNTGLPLQQQGTVHDPDASGLGPGEFTQLDFVVVDFEPGTMDCDISEVVPAGYEVSYFADIGEEGVAASVFDDDEGCHYEGLESADFICEISNELLPVTVTVNKEWVDDNPGFELPTLVQVTLWCTDPVANGGNQLNGNGFLFSAQQFIDPANPGVFDVFPHWDGTTECFVTEKVDSDVLPDTSDCESILLAPGVDGECTIVNTRLFAGIPTLSQYGLLLMALLMLGVGALAFRRYA